MCRVRPVLPALASSRASERHRTGCSRFSRAAHRAIAKVDPASRSDHVVIGNALQTSLTTPSTARVTSACKSGIAPGRAPALDRQPAVWLGDPVHRERRAADAAAMRPTTVLAGGMENMSQAPYVQLHGAREGFRFGEGSRSSKDLLFASALRPLLRILHGADRRERIAKRLEITREAPRTSTRCAATSSVRSRRPRGPLRRGDRARHPEAWSQG